MGNIYIYILINIDLKHLETKPHADSSHERMRTLSGTSLHPVTLAQWLKRRSEVDPQICS